MLFIAIVKRIFNEVMSPIVLFGTVEAIYEIALFIVENVNYFYNYIWYEFNAHMAEVMATSVTWREWEVVPEHSVWIGIGAYIFLRTATLIPIDVWAWLAKKHPRDTTFDV